MRRRLAAEWDLVAGLVVFAAYLAVAAVTASRISVANRNARWVDAAQHWLMLPDEAAINRWTAARRVLAVVANYHYAVGYLLTTAAVVVWLRVRRRSTYNGQAGRLLAINAVAIGVFLLFPVTPPRLLPGAGFVDTVELHRTVGSWGTGLVSQIANQHAAVPSLHVAWATWVALALIREGAGGWLKRTAVLHVGSTTAVIVMTGNHWLLDAVAGVIVAIVVEVAFRLVERARAGRPRIRMTVPAPRDGHAARSRPASTRRAVGGG